MSERRVNTKTKAATTAVTTTEATTTTTKAATPRPAPSRRRRSLRDSRSGFRFRTRSGARLATLLLAVLIASACASRGSGGPNAQRAGADDATATAADPARPLVGRAAVEAAEFPPVQFEPPRAERFTLSNGVTVFHLEDRTLPLVDIVADFKGGSVYFERDDFAAARAVGPLMLTGGTASLPPDSVAELIEFYALSPGVATGGSRSSASIGTLRRHLDVALELWTEMLREPRFDPERVEVWRRRELDVVRRSRDQPGTVAIREFNRLMYGDHPIGWITDTTDLAPERLDPERLRRVHRETYCAEHMILGITGDIGRDEARDRLEAYFGDWPACPRDLGRVEPLNVREEPAVLVVHRDLEQSTVVMGQAGRILRGDADAFTASQLANWILGGGGFSSRLMERLRTEEGLAYSAWSVWGAGTTHQRLFGVFTQTRAEATVQAIDAMREVLESMRGQPPGEDELRLAIDNTVNGFVFAFENSADVVARQMGYLAAGLPEDWLEQYIDGVQSVSPEAVHDVVARHIRPDSLSIVVIGDTTRFELPAGLRSRIIP